MKLIDIAGYAFDKVVLRYQISGHEMNKTFDSTGASMSPNLSDQNVMLILDIECKNGDSYILTVDFFAGETALKAEVRLGWHENVIGRTGYATIFVSEKLFSADENGGHNDEELKAYRADLDRAIGLLQQRV